MTEGGKMYKQKRMDIALDHTQMDPQGRPTYVNLGKVASKTYIKPLL